MPTAKPDIALTPSAKEKVMEMFKKYDTDGDGHIDVPGDIFFYIFMRSTQDIDRAF